MTDEALLPREEAEELYGDEADPDMYIVLSLDPGGTTGWSIFGIHPDAMSGDPAIQVVPNVEFWLAGQFEGEEHDQADEIVDLVGHWPSARLVCEDFILRKHSQARELLSPVRLTAVVSWAIRPRYLVLQQPSLAMTTITDERQKAMGFWLPGQQHARDAIKHNLTFLKRQRDRQVKAWRSVQNRA